MFPFIEENQMFHFQDSSNHSFSIHFQFIHYVVVFFFFQKRVFAQLPSLEFQISLDQSRKLLRILKSIADTFYAVEEQQHQASHSTQQTQQTSKPSNDHPNEGKEEVNPPPATPGSFILI